METLSLLAVNALNGGGGGGGGDVTPDGVTTEFNASEELQANAVIHVNALPSSGIKDNSLYHVNETVTYTVDGDTETFTMSKFFRHESGAWVSYTTISGLTQADYDHLTAAQKADGTNYIVNGGGRVTRMVYAALDGKPTLNSVTIDGDLTLEDINVYSIDEVDDLLAQKVAAEFVDELPATLVSNTWYYSKAFADGTLVPNDNRALYVLDADDVLQYMGVVGQVELDGYYTKGESDGRYYTKTDSDARYYTKTDSDDRYYTQTDADAKFQEKITDSTTSSVSDSTYVSSLSASAKTNARFSLATLWTWLTGKLKTAISSSLTNTDVPSGKAVYDYAVAKTSDASKVYGTNASGAAYNFDRVTTISSSSTDAQFPTAKTLYNYAVAKTTTTNRVYGSSMNYPVTDTYTSTADNQLFTRKGAYNLYNGVFSGNTAMVFAGNVTRNSSQSVNSNTSTAISLTGSDIYRTGLIRGASSGVYISVAGTYYFQVIARLADTGTTTRHWYLGLGVNSMLDDQAGGTWNYTYNRHKAEASLLRYCAAGEVIKPYVYIDSNSGSVQYATVHVWKCNEK